jgi:hypothetical protein
VAHYLIHSYDYPPIAERACCGTALCQHRAIGVACAAYAGAIFTDADYGTSRSETNLAAAAAQSHFDSLHALDYLEYAYLQQGRDGDAKGVRDQINAIAKVNPEHFVTAYALAAIPSRYALERGRWADASNVSPQPGERDFPWAKFPQAVAVMVYTRALGAARSGDAPAVRKGIDQLQSLRKEMIEAKIPIGRSRRISRSRSHPHGLVFAEGNKPEALKLMREGADMEDATEKHPVTPGHVVPARELLGDMLLELNQPALALKEFEASHKIEPGRFRGLLGAARSAELSGDKARAKSYYADLVRLDGKSDGERPELARAKPPELAQVYFFALNSGWPACHSRNAYMSAIWRCRCAFVSPIPWPAS